MQVAWVDPAEFRKRAWDFLRADEAANNVMFGTLGRAEAGDSVPTDFAIVADDGQVTMTAGVRAGEMRLGSGARAALPALVDSAAEKAFRLLAVFGPDDLGGAFADLWCAKTGAVRGKTTTMSVYRLGEVASVSGVPGQARRAQASDGNLLHAWTTDFWDQHLVGNVDIPALVSRGVSRGDVWLWCDPAGTPVSMAWRAGLTPNGARIGLVYTPPEERRKGYAQAVTAALSRQLLDDGARFCFLLADQADPSANKVYGNLGYRVVGLCAMVRIKA